MCLLAGITGLAPVAGGSARGQPAEQTRGAVAAAPAGWVPATQTPDAPRIDGFVLAQNPTAIRDTPAAAAAEHIDARQWVRAVQSIQAIDPEAHPYIIDKPGVTRPAARLRAALIRSMPEAGRRAFRKLAGPAAQAELKHARAIASLKDRAHAYAALIDRYPLCDAAGEAARELGGLYFAFGRFAQAASMFGRAIDHPANVGAEAELAAHRLVALARAERWGEFDELAEDAGFRHADTQVTLGGERLTLRDLIARLNQNRPDKDDTDNTPDRRFTLPAEGAGGLYRPLIDRRLQHALRLTAQKYKLNHVIDAMLAPRHAVDDGRLFTLALGRVARIDPDTGEDLWHFDQAGASGVDIKDHLNQFRLGYPQALAASGKFVLALVPLPDAAHPTRLIALDAATGALRWDWTQSAGAYRDMHVYGEPLIDGERVYVACLDERDAMLRVVTLDLSTGESIHATPLGRVVNDPRSNRPVEFSPRLALSEQHLIVQTNNGGVVALDREDQTLAWAFTQQVRLSGLSRAWELGHVPPGSVARHTGGVIAHGGLVLTKDTRGDTVYAFHAHDGRAAWSTKADPDATIVHTDERHAYVLGRELVALNLQTGEPAWSAARAGEPAGRPVFTASTCILAGDRCLCEIDLATGGLVKMNPSLQGRADLSIIAGRLIRVTDHRLTIHPLATRRLSALDHE